MERTTLEKFTTEVVQTRAFKRLSRISFLGIVDREIKRETPSARTFNRAQHSLGVLAFAKQVITLARLQREDAYHLTAAALLHDVAHPAFSHSLEYAFSRAERSLDHHEALRLMLLDDHGFSRDLHRVLQRAGVFPERLISIIDGSDKLNYFFSSPLNIDTLDGIRRSFLSVGILASYKDPLLVRILCATYCGQTISDPDLLDAADSFWRYKGRFYETLLAGRIANSERKFQSLVRECLSSLRPEYFFIGDDEFILRHPEIFRKLDDAAKGRLPSPKPLVDQHFAIDQSILALDKRTIFLRYRRHRAIRKEPSPQATLSGQSDQQIRSGTQHA